MEGGSLRLAVVIYISCGITEKNENTGGDEHLCG